MEMMYVCHLNLWLLEQAARGTTLFFSLYCLWDSKVSLYLQVEDSSIITTEEDPESLKDYMIQNFLYFFHRGLRTKNFPFSPWSLQKSSNQIPKS